MRTQLAFLVGILIGVGLSVAAVGYAKAERVPLNFVDVGSEPGYVHGDHCIDGRTF